MLKWLDILTTQHKPIYLLDIAETNQWNNGKILLAQNDHIIDR